MQEAITNLILSLETGLLLEHDLQSSEEKLKGLDEHSCMINKQVLSKFPPGMLVLLDFTAMVPL